MNNRYIVVVLALLTLSLSGCDKANEALEYKKKYEEAVKTIEMLKKENQALKSAGKEYFSNFIIMLREHE